MPACCVLPSRVSLLSGDIHGLTRAGCRHLQLCPFLKRLPYLGSKVAHSRSQSISKCSCVSYIGIAQSRYQTSLILYYLQSVVPERHRLPRSVFSSLRWRQHSTPWASPPLNTIHLKPLFPSPKPLSCLHQNPVSKVTMTTSPNRNNSRQRSGNHGVKNFLYRRRTCLQGMQISTLLLRSSF